MSQDRPARPLDGLSDFQRATAEHAFRRLYLDADSTRRFLVADETGLGKTHVARGVIALTLEHLQQVADVRRIDIVYVCSNTDIAAQNIRKLNVTGSHSSSFASRLGLLITQPEMLRPTEVRGRKPVTFVAFTPATSFQLGWQMGTADERAILYVLLRTHLGLRGALATGGQRIFQGAVATRRNFVQWYVASAERKSFDPGIRDAFLRAFDESPERAKLLRLVDDVAGRAALNTDQSQAARRVVAALRRLLARAAVRALEPDLVILDEFQRFRDLLDTETGGEAAQLADHFFNQPDARVLLLSATPYKPLTYADERAEGIDHYADFMKTLGFLAESPGALAQVSQDLEALRRAAMAGEPVVAIRDRLQSRLGELIARTERPAEPLSDANGGFSPAEALSIRAEDFADYVSLRRVAEAVDAPFTVEYWKSAPYFLNFLEGYQVGEQIRERMKKAESRATLEPLFRGARRIARSEVERFRPLDWGNARLRALADDTLTGGSWRLLWMPPSLRYHRPGGAYAAVSGDLTKRLIFSSWVAAPSAIASLLSYEVERRIFEGAGISENTPAARAASSGRLDYGTAGDRPAAMSTLALFWPHPALATVTDPLEAARDARAPLGVDDLIEWASQRAATLVGPPGDSRSTTSAVWHWLAPALAERSSTIGRTLLGTSRAVLVQTLQGITGGEAPDPADSSGALDAHVSLLLEGLGGWTPDVERPADLLTTSALLGLGGPGNIAWRSLARLRRGGSAITDLGHWRAAAVLASGLRSLFSRPDARLLLDNLYSGEGANRAEDGAYWRSVARYCIDGGLQAVLDEYVHHLAGETGVNTTTDSGLIDLAMTARRAIALRESVYRATDIDDFEGGISFRSRFALRFGNTRQAQEDARLPEVRAAFNSPFWPFVLATTSVGQEGVDFHWWCHSIVHWNLPANPVDFEQREGRVNRYRGHAIRKNVAADHRAAALARGVTDPWSAAFEAAAADRDERLGDLKPSWVYPGAAKVERRILAFPLSRDEKRWDRLRESLALYRLAERQPRQEDMLAALERRGVANDPKRIAELQIDLRPPRARPAD